MKRFVLSALIAASLGCQTTPKPMAANTSTDATVSEGAMYAPEANRYPADISSVGSKDYRVEDCYPSHAGEVYKILVNGSDANQGGRLDSQGCFKTTFRDGKLRPGDNVVIHANGSNLDSQTVPGGNGGNNGGGNGGGNYPQPPPQVPNADLGKVRITAENNARCMANAVVAAYGRVERFRYNYFMGLRNGIGIYNLVNLGSLQNTAEFMAGAQQGQADGSANGLVKGRAEGADDGGSQGRTDARSRFVAVVDTGNPPNRDLTVPPSGFSGLSSGQQPRTIEQRLSALDSDTYSWLNQQSFSYDGWSYGSSYGDYWSASRLYSWNGSYQFDLVNSWYRDDWAFDLWKQRRFSRCADQVEYYNKLSDSSQTGNSSNATSTFRSAFKSEYDQVIGSKWRNEVTQSEPVAYSFGQQHGLRVAREYARDVGYYNAYNVNYSTASIQGHSETYDGAYQNSFSSTFQRYESSAVGEGFDVDFRTNNAAQRFGAGSPVGIIVKKAVNLGLKDGTYDVKLGSNYVMSQTKKITLKKSESLKQPIALPDMGYVGFNAAPGAATKISANIGGAYVDMDFKVDWAATVYNLGTLPAGNVKNVAVSYVKNNLAAEYKKMIGIFKANLYLDKNPSNTLLEQFVRVYENPGSSAAFKAGIKAMAANLKTCIGARPSGLFAGGKKEWDAAAALFDRLAK